MYAQTFEDRVGSDDGAVDRDGLTPSTARALEHFENVVVRVGGRILVTSAYRPASYQEHLQNVWDKWMVELRNNQDPNCSQLKAGVQDEFMKHQLLETQRPVPYSDHTKGIGFDAACDLAALRSPQPPPRFPGPSRAALRRNPPGHPARSRTFPPAFAVRWIFAAARPLRARACPLVPSETEHSHGLVRGFGLLQSTALNMTNMVGVGPFITIPLIISAMGGPQCMLGWLLGAVSPLCDGLVWAELAAAMPGTGGTYHYFQEIFRKTRLGADAALPLHLAVRLQRSA